MEVLCEVVAGASTSSDRGVGPGQGPSPDHQGRPHLSNKAVGSCNSSGSGGSSSSGTTADAQGGSGSISSEGGGPVPSAPSSTEDAVAAVVPGPAQQRPGQQPVQQQPQPGQVIATALFVMALRDPSLKRSMAVPPLHPQTPLEQQLAAAGAARSRWVSLQALMCLLP